VKALTRRGSPPHGSPALVYADARGRILDFPGLEAAGSSAGRWVRPEPQEWIPLPPGSELFLLPGRLPVGLQPGGGQPRVLEADPFSGDGAITAVAAFVAPAHTQLYSAAYRSGPAAPLLPLFAYTAVGWLEGGFVTTAVRIDPDPRQDEGQFDPEEVRRQARRRLREGKHNRLVQHLGRCALQYGCPAARNWALGRWEAPLPCSPGCNARCLGCISLQEDSGFCATQERIRFVPTPEEIAEVGTPHLASAPRAVASFGQGCEGEPLLQTRSLAAAILRMRRATSRGTINLNTNGSLPASLARLCDSGLDSVRVSLNSCRPELYERYYRPQGYGFADVQRSLRLVEEAGRFASLNYFVLPGLTDEPAELAALCRLLERAPVQLLQMRNLNIDPEWYLQRLQHRPAGRPLGMRRLLQELKRRFPALRLGYFNPCLDPTA
jgi:pyruvate-formate lyase-activating enzyme